MIKYKSSLIIILTLTVGVLIFYLIKKSTKTGESVLYHNTINSVSKKDITSEEAILLEICKVWGVLKHHSVYSKNSNKIHDEIITKSFSKIVEGKINVNTIVSEWIMFSNNGDDNIPYIGQFPDKNWIESSTLLKEKNKLKLKQYIISSYNDPSKRLVTKNSFGELNFDDDHAFFDEATTTKELRFLSLCKLWNIIRYYYPYFETISEDWNDVFLEMLPLFINAKTENEYFLAVQKFTSKIKDSHTACKVFNSKEDRKTYVSNYILKTLNDTTYVKGFVNKSANNKLQIGDIVQFVDGVPIKPLQDSLSQYLSGSNQVVLLRDINKAVLNSNDQKMTLEIIRNNKRLVIAENRIAIQAASEREEREHKKHASQVASKIIGNNIGYIDISQIFLGNFRVSFEKIKNCKAIIFDLRKYPNEIGTDFIKYFDIIKNRPMILYSSDVIYPGVMKTINENVEIPDEISNSYSRPVIILTNEYTQSQGESLLLAMRSSIKNSITMGDYTAGTNGNIAVVSLPGKIKIKFSGIGVLRNNYTKTQRVGIKPDVLIHEDKNNLKMGTDKQLEQALLYINTI